MDPNRFDTLTRSLTAARSRRAAVGVAIGSALGLLGVHPEQAAAQNPLKKCHKIDDKQKKKACIKKAKKHTAQHASEIAAPPPADLATVLPPPPTTCTPNCSGGRNCGSNGCSGGSCGSCSGPETCGGGGTAGVCGCTPTTCAAQNRTCGQLADGCGATLPCGTCDAGQRCAGGTCVCDAQSCAGCCDGTTCKDGNTDGACGGGGGACSSCDAIPNSSCDTTTRTCETRNRAVSVSFERFDQWMASCYVGVQVTSFAPGTYSGVLNFTEQGTRELTIEVGADGTGSWSSRAIWEIFGEGYGSVTATVDGVSSAAEPVTCPAA